MAVSECYHVYDCVSLGVYAALVVLAGVCALHLFYHDGCHLTARKKAYVLVLLFALFRLVEFALRLSGRFASDNPDSGWLRGLYSLLFLMPMAFMFSTYTVILDFIAQITAATADWSRVNVVSLGWSFRVLNGVVYLLSVVIMAVSSTTDKTQRYVVTASYNLVYALACLVVVACFLWFTARLVLFRKIVSESGSVNAMSGRNVLKALLSFILLGGVATVCLSVYSGILVSDAFYLFKHHDFPTHNWAYTHSCWVLFVFRFCEATPPTILTYITATVAVGGGYARVSDAGKAERWRGSNRKLPAI